MNILGLSCFYHDAAAALLQDGALVAAAEEERFSRLKHDSGYPSRAIQFCLESAKIQSRDLDYVIFYEKPFVKFERILTTSLYRETGQRRLCMAGGVALNSVANGRLLKETPFEEIYIQPAAGDSGAALGAALYAYHMLLGQPRQFLMEHAYWGKNFDSAAIHDVLSQENIRAEEFADEEKLLDRVADMLSQGKVAGWYQGRFEWGPRALGHRSIIGDPRRAEMKDVVNTKIKFREPYRPFAPSVLESRASEFFDLPSPERHYPSRFMLYVVGVNDDA
ncbi:MAG TPA: carbamoyltransferase N-terminal domain-containing protein, partial [Candidatus Limnocylindria bacterium]|nr:carbamoyltransferase N-terminal domain-containing protein [Candidatus Limnocylindria bacterium]